MFWGLFINLVVVLFVVNALIWLRERERPAILSDDRELFGGVTRSFGGADFLGAALVIVVNLLINWLIMTYATSEVPLDEARALEPAEMGVRVNWALFALCQVVAVVMNTMIIAWRNRQFLDWRWSAAAACMILALGWALAFGLGILMAL